MDAEKLNEGKKWLKAFDAQLSKPCLFATNTDEKEMQPLHLAKEGLKDWLWNNRDELIADAGRMLDLTGRAYVTINIHQESLWTLRGIYEVHGKDFIYAIDAAMGDKP